MLVEMCVVKAILLRSQEEINNTENWRKVDP